MMVRISRTADDAPEVDAFKQALCDLCAKHGLYVGVTKVGDLGIWKIGPKPFGEYDLEDIVRAMDLSTPEKIALYKSEHPDTYAE